jgi:hypothetical protein
MLGPRYKTDKDTSGTATWFRWWPHFPNQADSDALIYNVFHMDGHTDTHLASRFDGWNNSKVQAFWRWTNTTTTKAYDHLDTDNDRQ